MSVMESPLEVLSRAATMVQDNANEARLTTKELPTTKWRRDRRLRANEYHHHSHSSSSSMSPLSPQNLHHPHSPQNSTNNTNGNMVRPLSETTQNSITETPLDMSVTSAMVKQRSPPPPYREPLPGSTFATALARPSVITQAPPKRDSNNHNQNFNSISNRENDNSVTAESNSVCDPVIDEHFRRSLGADYMNLFKKKSSPPTSSASSPQEPQPAPPGPQQKDEESEEQHSPKHRTTVTVNGESVGTSVDDHFAKALGDTWKKLQADKAKNDE
ncbi:transcription cofactor vestigial-like protein 4 isoform X2 [Hermetia illucens]|uniref:transcription cofactor vestigial-like protein 4 isoform X2 n=1 Tax=Hermetia illucens TaxID=343691 RepID=UPI0018CC4AFD|nr:transcription cofactor vestigial-like protein 4 isoform X2 [Hermetia illucens]